MLCSAAVIDSLASTLRSLYPSSSSSIPPIVIDPVTISTSGHTLLPTSAISALKSQIIPLGLVLTPNVLEAEMLLSDEGAHGEGLEAKSKLLAEGKRRITDLSAMFTSAKELAALGCPDVLLKGGHLALELSVVKAQLRVLQASGALSADDILWPTGDGVRILETINGSSDQQKVVVDVLWQSKEDRCTAIVSRLVPTKNTHGTGCTLSAALAVYLGKGLKGECIPQWLVSLRRGVLTLCSLLCVQCGKRRSSPTTTSGSPSRRRMTSAQATDPSTISSPSPTVPWQRACPLLLSPFFDGHRFDRRRFAIFSLPLSPTAAAPQPFTNHLISSVKPLWKKYINHPFVLQLGQGKLDQRRFAHYLRQDWLYLRHYARAHALMSFKATSFEDITAFSGIALHVGRESNMHVTVSPPLLVPPSRLSPPYKHPR